MVRYLSILVSFILTVAQSSALTGDEGFDDGVVANQHPNQTSMMGVSKVNLSSVDERNLAGSCTTPLEYVKLPGSFSIDEYSTFRDQCTQKCNNNGYCCTKGMGGCNALPCNTGCHIAFFTDDVAACKAECTRGNSLECYYPSFHHEQIAHLGYNPWWNPDGSNAVGKCWGSEICGCPTNDSFGNDCSSEACEKGCELAGTVANSFNGEDAKVDNSIGLSLSDLKDSITSLKSHVDGTSTLTKAQVRQTKAKFEENSKLLDHDFDAMDSAFDLVDAYESQNGALFINSKTQGGFPRTNNGDQYELERAILAVQQGILDEVYEGTSESIDIHNSIVENCENYLRGRYWQTARFFPGFVDLPNNPNVVYTAKVEATMNEFWGNKVCFAEDPLIRPTGIYLAPGGIATVEVPQGLVNSGFQIQVGATSTNHDNKDNNRRMDRITSTYEIKSTTTHIASPLGGGIYIIVPYLASEGTIDVNISGDVLEAPLFSMTSLKTTSATDWNTLRTSGAPWVDIVTDKLLLHVPTSWIYDYSYWHMKTVVEGHDLALSEVNKWTGYPSGRRNNYVSYVMPDLDIRHCCVYGVGYPQVNQILESGPNGPIGNGRSDHWFVSEPFLQNSVYWHELGHCTIPIYYDGETEAIVNYLYAHVRNVAMGLDLDLAFKRSFNSDSELTPDNSAIDWMIRENFRNGNEMDKTNSEYNEMRYQEKGYAKYADISRLFGWQVMQTYNNQENIDRPNGIDENDFDLHSTDYRTLKLSIAAGVDITPLIHFWGTHPKDPEKLKNYMEQNNLSVPTSIYNLLTRYLTLIPMTRNDYQDYVQILYPTIDLNDEWYCPSPLYGCGYHNVWQFKWTTAMANKAVAELQTIIDLYYGSAPPPSPTPPSPTPGDCTDATLRFKITKNDGKKIMRDCGWVSNKNTVGRCSFTGVPSACPSSCGTCSVCEDSTLRFKITKNDGKKILRYCGWVSNKNTVGRCALDGVSLACRDTCGTC